MTTRAANAMAGGQRMARHCAAATAAGGGGRAAATVAVWRRRRALCRTSSTTRVAGGATGGGRDRTRRRRTALCAVAHARNVASNAILLWVRTNAAAAFLLAPALANACAHRVRISFSARRDVRVRGRQRDTPRLLPRTCCILPHISS